MSGIRHALGRRYGWFCHLCLGPVDPSLPWNDPVAATADHLVPKSKGGGDGILNKALAHRICNEWRGDMDLLPARELRRGWTPPQGWPSMPLLSKRKPVRVNEENYNPRLMARTRKKERGK